MYNFESCLENTSPLLRRNSAKVLNLKDGILKSWVFLIFAILSFLSRRPAAVSSKEGSIARTPKFQPLQTALSL